ncbi:MAG: endonuclease III [Muribaculaceae bacterium]|nr:endonuclease III [Muribaculaceae bacterium]
MTTKERYQGVIDYFKEAMPSPTTELHYNSPYELLVAVILSAQCTDKRINMVTPALFKAYPTPYEMAKATADDIFQYIKSVTFPNNKSKSLLGMANMLIDKYNGEVPSSIDELVKIPGVGRKTANVILSVVFNKATMAVDTHVFRVSNRIGLTTDSKTPLETERTLVKNFPEELLATAHHWLILHGRYVCTARKPNCLECGLRTLCKFYKKSI